MSQGAFDASASVIPPATHAAISERVLSDPHCHAYWIFCVDTNALAWWVRASDVALAALWLREQPKSMLNGPAGAHVLGLAASWQHFQ